MSDAKQRWWRPWWIWLVPLLSLAFATYLVTTFIDWHTFRATVAFDDVDGIEAGKTKVKYRGIVVGEVTRVHLSTRSAIVADVHLRDEIKPLVKNGATFWLIEPNIGINQIQGMGTLFAGPYLELHPGAGKRDSHFLGISRPPRPDERFGGVLFRLRSSVNPSLSPGNPIRYRGIRIGAVTDVHLSDDARFVEVEAKVSGAYDHLVRTNSVFWKDSGIQADIGLLGAKINVPTLESLMTGGVSLATPDKPGPKAEANRVFDLFPEAKKEWQQWSPRLTS